jgi:hypothetical protein
MAACSGSGSIKIKDPGPVAATTTTTELDLSGVGLKGVSGRGTTTIPLGPGAAMLSGTVAGPDGAVDAATVHVERIVGTAVAVMDVPTLPDGTWTLPAILGGRYRVRTWRAPDLAQTKPELFYLEASEKKTLALRVDKQAGGAVSASIAPSPPVLNQPANLFVLVTQKSVDSGGVVRAVAVVGASVSLLGNGYQVETPNPTATDGNGVAQWRVRCTVYGETNLQVAGPGGASFPLKLPACVDSSTGAVTSTTETSRTTRTVRTTTTRRGA